jgi:hypothetical protein
VCSSPLVLRSLFLTHNRILRGGRLGTRDAVASPTAHSFTLTPPQLRSLNTSAGTPHTSTKIMQRRWLLGTEERARDVQRKISTCDTSSLLREDFTPVLKNFQELSQQLSLLQERGTDLTAALDKTFVVPSGVSGLDAAAAVIPHLLSTMLDKEQVDEDASASRRAEAAGSGDWTKEQHNKVVSDAHDFLAAAALAADLPGAAKLAQLAGGTSLAIAPAPAAMNSTTAPAPSSSRGSAANADGDADVRRRLLNAMRTGAGLEPAKRPEGEQQMEEQQRKRARTG